MPQYERDLVAAGTDNRFQVSVPVTVASATCINGSSKSSCSMSYSAQLTPSPCSVLQYDINLGQRS